MAGSNSNTTKSYSTLRYKGRVVRIGDELEEVEVVRLLAEKMPEFNIEFIEGEYDDSFSDCYSHAHGHYTRDSRDWVDGYWTIDGEEMSISDLYDHLMTKAQDPKELTEACDAPESPCIPLNLPTLKRLVLPGTEFIVTFSDSKFDEPRTMCCRQSATEDWEVRNDDSKGLFTVFDMTANEHHSFPIKTIQSVEIMDRLFRFKEAV